MISESIKYIGVNDRALDLFEGQYVVPNGMAYNSYVIIDEKIAVMDTVSEGFGDKWLENLTSVIGDAIPDYLVVQHMEPDHSANILKFTHKYPDAKIIASDKALVMMKNFFDKDFSDRAIIVRDGDKISLGSRELTFIAAPMVHWPEVIVTYDSKDKALFSADAFGKFGALDADEDWTCEARRYYFGIVGKYGVQVQALLKKAATLDIRIICPLHGPVLSKNLEYYFDLYNTWSSYKPEEKGIMIAYTSVYGNTERAVGFLRNMIYDHGCPYDVVLHDLARCDIAEAVEDAFRYDKLVLAATTYNGDIFPFMREFISYLTERNYANRAVATIENGSWAPTASKIMREMLSKSKNITFVEPNVRIISAPNDDVWTLIESLAIELIKDY